MSHTHWQINKADVVFTPIDKEGVVLNLRTKYYFTLNETALHIWQRLEEGLSTEAIIESLTAEFDIDATTCQQDMEQLLTHLKREALILART